MKKITLLIVLCSSLTFIQCNSDDNQTSAKTQTEENSDEIKTLLKFVSEEFQSKEIAYDAKREVFIIEKDILLSLEDVQERYKEFGEHNATNKSNQRVSQYTVLPQFSSAALIYISPDVPSAWQVAINQAVLNWNTTNSRINISIVQNASIAHTTITTINNGKNGIIATSYFPALRGITGKNVEINIAYNSITASDKTSTMVHELGHIFGIHHTDELTKGSPIVCTPATDPTSVMLAIIHPWTGFSTYDMVAYSTLYPLEIGSKKLYRYKKNNYYFYTTDPCEVVFGKDGYVFDGDVGYLYSTQVSGTVPLYRSINGTIAYGHKLSTSKISSQDVILGYLYPTAQPKTTALYYNENSGQQKMYTVQKTTGLTQTTYGYVLYRL